MFPVPGPRARVDRARLPGDRQRPGRHRRRRPRRRGARSSGFRRREAGGRVTQRSLGVRTACAARRALARRADRSPRSPAWRSPLAACSWRAHLGHLGRPRQRHRLRPRRRRRASPTGELPYVDFVYYYGPLAPALVGSPRCSAARHRARDRARARCSRIAIVARDLRAGADAAGPLGGFLAAALTAAVAFVADQLQLRRSRTRYSATLGDLASRCAPLRSSRYARRRHASAGSSRPASPPAASR